MAERDTTRRRKPANEATGATGVYGHLQPQALEVEKTVLGALMIDKDAYAVVCETLYPES